MAILHIDTNTLEGYKLFLRIKGLPRYRFSGHTAHVPDEYLSGLGMDSRPEEEGGAYHPIAGLFDYQRDIARLAIRKRKFAVFAEPGLGKTLISCEYVRHGVSQLPENRCGLMIAPPMVVRQTLQEIDAFYGKRFPVEHLRASELQEWLLTGTSRVGITNWEALREGLRPGRLGLIAGDETQIMKSAYGAYGQRVIALGRGLAWKLCATGTPAPNDRIEYAN